MKNRLYSIFFYFVFMTAFSLMLHASIPPEAPVFSEHLNITNRFYPIKSGAMKIYTIHAGETIGVIVDFFQSDTKTFIWNEQKVKCRLMKSLQFEFGELIEISRNYFAQADDGAIYYFGEFVEVIRDGETIQYVGWMVDGHTFEESELPEQPDLLLISNPAVFMPGNPERGDLFKPEDAYPIMDETDEVIDAGVYVSVPGGAYSDAIKIRETTRLDPDSLETKWYAPGEGLVKGIDSNWEETLVLVASTVSNPSLTKILNWQLFVN